MSAKDIITAKVTAEVKLEHLILDQAFTAYYAYFLICRYCRGHQKVRTRLGTRPCSACHGKGGTQRRDSVKVSLSPGDIDNRGGTYTIPHKGHMESDGTRGDLEIALKVNPHPLFTPEGKDLVFTLPLSPLQKRFGCHITLPTLSEDRKEHLKGPLKREYRAPQAGGYQKGDPERGDIIYRITERSNPLERDALDTITHLEKELANAASDIEELRKAQCNKEAHEQEVARLKAEAQAAAETEALRATSALANDLLPSIDSLEKALEVMAGSDAQGHREGIEMILNMQRETLARHGIETIAALGETFDPHAHEAVAMDPHSDLPRNTVSEVLQTGYQHNGKLLRPAMVRVSG